MYFSQWQRERKKSFVQNPEAEAGMIAKELRTPPVDREPTREASELCEAPILVSLVVRERGEFLEDLGFLPN